MARQLCTAVYLSPLGRITLASEGEQLVGLWFEGQRYYGAGLLPGLAEPCGRSSTPAPLCTACTWLDAYFTGQRPEPTQLALAPGGTPFQQAVWQQLLQIPYGHTTTYGALAKALQAMGIAASAQAVGGAVGRNPISIIIPCHRVVAADPGKAWSYAAGARVKRALLLHEGWPANC